MLQDAIVLKNPAKNMLEIETSTVQNVSNKFPGEPMPTDGKITSYKIIDGKITGVSGQREFDFVINKDGNLIIGKKHNFLAGDADVQAAGQIRLNGKGQIRSIDNLSGHYQPTPAETAGFITSLQNTGLNLQGATLNTFGLTTNTSGMVTGVSKISSTVIK